MGRWRSPGRYNNRVTAASPQRQPERRSLEGHPRSRIYSDYDSSSVLASPCLECPLTVPGEPLLVVVVGPTGSGKTALSLALAEHFRGEIVNCD